MTKKAVLFPGQGSQFVGMGIELAKESPHFDGRLKQADTLLGYELSKIMFEGPEEKLMQTKFTQPAIFLHSTALFEILEPEPDMAAGHSLGELSALVAAGVLEFEQGLGLVALRGELMQKAGERNPGAMAAVIGMDDEVVELICDEVTQQTFKPVVAANYNSPGQVVISGDPGSVELAVELAKGRGCRLARLLPVSGAFHSPLMEQAYREFGEALGKVAFSEPAFPVYCNVTGEATTDPDLLREQLHRQLISPVRWTRSLQQMFADGARHFLEVGPGKVLQGLVKRTLEDVEISGRQ